MNKTCTKCGEEKPLDQFNKNRGSKDGLSGLCKACTREKNREWRRRNLDKQRQYTQEWRERNPAAARESWRRYRVSEKGKANKRRERINNRAKYQARAKVDRELRSGRLTRPEGCERCGARGAMQAHHDDYSKPLEIEWLCAGCHKDHHKTAVA